MSVGPLAQHPHPVFAISGLSNQSPLSSHLAFQEVPAHLQAMWCLCVQNMLVVDRDIRLVLPHSRQHFCCCCWPVLIVLALTQGPARGKDATRIILHGWLRCCSPPHGHGVMFYGVSEGRSLTSSSLIWPDNAGRPKRLGSLGGAAGARSRARNLCMAGHHLPLGLHPGRSFTPLSRGTGVVFPTTRVCR